MIDKHPIARMRTRLLRLRIKRKFDQAPIIIGGCGRSGTTLLLSVLSAHPGIYAIPEETDIFCPGAWKEGGRQDASFDYDKLCVKYLNKSIPRICRRWCEKTPKNILFIGRILDFFNYNVKFIHIVRDGRDVIFSRHPRRPGQYWVSPERWISEVKAGQRYLGHPNVYTVRYEDLVLNYTQTVKNLLDFLELDFIKSMDDFYSSASVRNNVAWKDGLQPLYRGSIGVWQRHQDSDRLYQFVSDPRAQRLLKCFGYNTKG